MDHFTLNFDGACWPNPAGTASYGYILSKNGQVVKHGNDVIGTGPGMSNNFAEFFALYQGLRGLASIIPADNPKATVAVYGDSDLVIKIMNKKWRPKQSKLYYMAAEKAIGFCHELRKSGVIITFDWIPREKNTQADDLSKAHLEKL
jgi:ribonuclease HI